MLKSWLLPEPLPVDVRVISPGQLQPTWPMLVLAELVVAEVALASPVSTVTLPVVLPSAEFPPVSDVIVVVLSMEASLVWVKTAVSLLVIVAVLVEPEPLLV